MHLALLPYICVYICNQPYCLIKQTVTISAVITTQGGGDGPKSNFLSSFMHKPKESDCHNITEACVHMRVYIQYMYI